MCLCKYPWVSQKITFEKEKKTIIEMELRNFHPIVIIIEKLHDIIYLIPSDAKSRTQKYHFTVFVESQLTQR